MIHHLHAVGLFIMALMVLFGCQPAGPKTAKLSAETDTASTAIQIAASPAGPDWGQGADCRGMLLILQRGLNDGRLLDLEGTPFSLIDAEPTSARHAWLAPSGWGDPLAGQSLTSDEARCIIRIGTSSDQRREHRVLGREQVRSRYQSGSRSEKNPAYDVAKARLRLAEKAAKPGKSSAIKMGDPLIDLFGMLVGGALTGFGQWGAGDQLEEALDTLMATPASIEKPKYKPYQFERARVRAVREATLPMILTDRHLGRSWETRLKRREVKEFRVIEGLDPQDADYARHRAENLTDDGLRRWLAEPPPLPLADMVAALLDRPSDMPMDRLALRDHRKGDDDRFGSSDRKAHNAQKGPDDREREVGTDPLPGDEMMDAGAAPPLAIFASKSKAAPTIARRAGLPLAPESEVTVIGETGSAGGIYVAPHFILSLSDVVDGRGLVDVEDRPGRLALGLVAAVDEGLGLALIQAPSPGRPVPLAAPSQKSGAWSPAGEAKDGPLVVAGQLVGFRTSRGPDIESDAIQAFLRHQRHLLLVETER